jgi:menaquinone-dependent protoporphyrinogen IX oxidase
MAKTAVVYRTKYGSTKKYADWIAEAVGADLLDAAKIRIGDLLGYDTIIYGGGLYAGGILGFSLIKKNYEKLSGKNLIVFAVGATLKKEDAAKEVKEINLPEEMRSIPFFLLRGGLNYKKMNVIDRVLMFLRVNSIKKKDPGTLDNDSKGVLATYGKVVDFTSKKAIEPIVSLIKSGLTF